MNHADILISPKALDYWEIRANKVLSNFKYNYPDDINIEEICWRYGVHIMPLDNIFFDGEITDDMISHSVIKKHGRRGTIYLRPNLDYDIRKVIIAEEFCHIYADTTNQINCDDIQLNKSEHRAKRMAAYLLMPQHFLMKVLNLSLEENVLVSDIADYFLVTEEFAHYRLELLFKHRVDLITSYKGQIGAIQYFD